MQMNPRSLPCVILAQQKPVIVVQKIILREKNSRNAQFKKNNHRHEKHKYKQEEKQCLRHENQHTHTNAKDTSITNATDEHANVNVTVYQRKITRRKEALNRVSLNFFFILILF